MPTFNGPKAALSGNAHTDRDTAAARGRPHTYSTGYEHRIPLNDLERWDTRAPMTAHSSARMRGLGIALFVLLWSLPLAGRSRAAGATGSASVHATKAGCTLTVNQLQMVPEANFGYLEEFGSVRCSRGHRHVRLKGEIDHLATTQWLPVTFTSPPYRIKANRVDRFRFRILCRGNTDSRVRATFTLHSRTGSIELTTPRLDGSFQCPT